MTTAPGPLIDSTVVENLILRALVAGPGAESIRVYAPEEAPPSSLPDKAGDSPPTRWCRLNPIILTPKPTQRIHTLDSAMATATITITIGCSPEAVDPGMGGSPARLNADAFAVANAVDGAMIDHDDTTHRVRCGQATIAPTPLGGSSDGHALLQTRIVTLNAEVTRRTGRTASLTTT